MFSIGIPEGRNVNREQEQHELFGIGIPELQKCGGSLDMKTSKEPLGAYLISAVDQDLFIIEMPEAWRWQGMKRERKKREGIDRCL
jgi:hypothetical protein